MFGNIMKVMIIGTEGQVKQVQVKLAVPNEQYWLLTVNKLVFSANRK
ncbi:hypothetical protein [Yersinia alsatica]|uniref:Uncharacterized protein n=1 Tax=Yersinia alsatica TaxID=2890317 RepID=A0ABY5UWI1_9GAMM|nr:hypothetical protein [Yersinia alsatica]UWM46323.1 hypothetical protein N0H69_05695 [Yersinia alsatica]CNK46852.1 Uncharacterised protein [Yersinia frederiksenii]CNL26895.1 Uncharacterised protein [Yersinia frederiksenii]